jgi:hypothetical protein
MSGALVAAAALSILLAVPASAAMPVTGAATLALESPVIQVAKKKKMTRRQEADQSAKDGTVPARYRANVPKEYHQYIPFAKQ